MFPMALVVKNLPANTAGAGDQVFDPWVRKLPWRRAWLPTPAFLPGESPWTEEPGGLQSVGSQAADATECSSVTFQSLNRPSLVCPFVLQRALGLIRFWTVWTTCCEHGCGGTRASPGFWSFRICWVLRCFC